MDSEASPARVLLLGLDGATFDLLDRLTARGLMPGLGRWKEEGSSGELRSTTPPTTPPAWSSCVTGMRPGRHGVFDFREPFGRDPKRPLITNASLMAPPLWARLGEAGLRSCVLNYPIAWPAEPIEGTLVTGFMTPDGAPDFVSPASEGEALRAAVPDYVPNVDIPRYDAEQLPDALRFLDDLERSLDARIAAFWHFYGREDWDFYFPTFVFHDRLGHLFWKIAAEEDGWADHPHTATLLPRIHALYARFDALLVRLLEERPPGMHLLMCSDHGFGGTQGFFEVNTWLQQQGLLVLRGQARARSRAFYAAMELGESRLGRALLPDGLRSSVRRRLRSRRSSFRNDLAESVDWERTKAFFVSVPQQGIALCRGGPAQPGGIADEEEAQAVREQIRRGLSELCLDDGKPLLDRIWFREELYEGPHACWAPDLILEARKYAVVARPVLGAPHWYRDASDQPVGFHRMGGVWMALGEGVRPRHHIDGACIEDVCPTVLHLLGQPIPEGMDGRLLDACLEPAWLREHPPRYRSDVSAPDSGSKPKDPRPPRTQDGLDRRLEALGYLDLG